MNESFHALNHESNILGLEINIQGNRMKFSRKQKKEGPMNLVEMMMGLWDQVGEVLYSL